jgi:lipopolysaccharide/colanic/teichoic acid biosynthesis glycosyltransferase
VARAGNAGERGALTKEVPEFEYRKQMKAGLTGMAQIVGKYNTTPRDKMILDMFYIENFSLMLDAKMILSP